MHTNAILTNKRRTHTQSNYTSTKLKAWFGRLLRHPARKRSGSILHRHTPGPTRWASVCQSVCPSHPAVLSKQCKLGSRDLHCQLRGRL